MPDNLETLVKAADKRIAAAERTIEALRSQMNAAPDAKKFGDRLAELDKKLGTLENALKTIVIKGTKTEEGLKAVLTSMKNGGGEDEKFEQEVSKKISESINKVNQKIMQEYQAKIQQEIAAAQKINEDNIKKQQSLMEEHLKQVLEIRLKVVEEKVKTLEK